MIDDRRNRFFPFVRKSRSLHTQNAALSRPFKKIHIVTVFGKIQHRKKQLFKITVVSAVQKYRPFRSFMRSAHAGFCVHNRKTDRTERNVEAFNRARRKIIGIVRVKQIGGFFIIRKLVTVSVRHKKFAHAIISDRVFGSAFFERIVSQADKRMLPVVMRANAARHGGRFVQVASVPVDKPIKLKIIVCIVV